MAHIVEASDNAIAEAARLLAAGDVVAFPTETVYGLGASTFDASALLKVYEIKGRPFDNPLIAHVIDASQARSLVHEWPARAEALAQRFWPGPLTMILERRDAVPAEATAGLPTIAVRAPSHPIARQLIEAFGGPISAPSANRSGRISPTRAEHVADDFADLPDLTILDGGSSECGIESTVLDLTMDRPRILRPGSIDEQSIAAALGESILSPEIDEQAASPGTSPRHYAPRTPVAVLDRYELLLRLRETGKPIAAMMVGEAAVESPHQLIAMPEDAEAYAAQFYDALRRADAMGVSAILIERPPHAGGLWRAIHNRLQRATHPP
jgi:L-threonylcarbamoyladenylate synthase